ncbi:LysE family translocator [Wenxinia saemankumensis]|uniref:Threonine/homoserine/homoserine lactone efflux protein n=1 Tax=Wenxinia saemankumensis TaxID=1447782 RepID=A0A1M6EIY5_9RHOB|nr:LysE family translocator [Wenxinia saemankumensis]SHI85465.1 Threonine/homoserine/homoserine lactone efflux protein [Wenxinia saemankumensis]
MSPHFLLTALVVVLVPGTGVVYTLAVALGQGRRAALWAAFGCTLGIMPALAAAILGLSAILHASALAFGVVKWAGIAYLLWLGWGALRGSGALAIRPDAARRSGPGIAARGALINVLNPKLTVFFLALLPPFLSGDPARASAEMAGLGGIFMAMTFAVFALYGLFAARLRARVLSSPRAMAWLGRSVAGVMAALAGRLATERA